MERQEHTRESLIRAAVRYGKSVDGPLSLVGLCQHGGVPMSAVYSRFLGGFGELLKEAGLLGRCGRAMRLTRDDLLAEVDRVARLRGRMPIRREVEHLGRFSASTYDRRFGRWKSVTEAYKQWKSGQNGQGCAGRDGAGSSKAGAQGSGAASVGFAFPRGRGRRNPLPPGGGAEADPGDRPRSVSLGMGRWLANVAAGSRFGDKPPVGRPLGFRGLQFEPRNEMGVVHAFGLLAPELEIGVEAIGSAYPDCQAIAPDGVGGWRRIAVEFEFRSSNFKAHGHNPAKCDLIVCWEHDWPDCPVKVMELKSVMRRVAGAGGPGSKGGPDAVASVGTLGMAPCATKEPGRHRLDSESGCRAGRRSGGRRQRRHGRRGCRSRTRGRRASRRRPGKPASRGRR